MEINAKKEIAKSKRKLTAKEIEKAQRVFGESIDYSFVTITRDHILSFWAPKVIGNTIYMRSDWEHFIGATLELNRRGMYTLIHELAHIWQYQNGGLAYIPGSVYVQLKAWMHQGSRSYAYKWQQPYQRQEPWEKWNPEQQAQAIEDFYIATCVGNKEQIAIIQPYIDLVREGIGAPSFW